MLSDGHKPIVACVGRPDTQKEVHLIEHALACSLEGGAQFAPPGSSPELGINDECWHLKHDLDDNPDCRLEIGLDEEPARLIYAGSDIMVVPSMFEPCGLTRMIALRYGTVPVVRAVGGLVDRVFDRDHSERPMEQRNGYIFRDFDSGGLESALSRALGLWRDSPAQFGALARQGMACDCSWNRPGQRYADICEYVRHR